MAAELFGLAPAFGFKTITPSAFGKILEGTSNAEEAHTDGQEDDDTRQSICFIISMAPLDRLILEDLDKRYNLLQDFTRPQNHKALLQHLFWNWDWTYTVSSNIVNLFTNPVGWSGLQRHQALQQALHLAGSFQGHAVQEFRARIARDDNQDFLQQLGNKPVSCIEFVPSIEDNAHWDILSAMFSKYPTEMLFWMNAAARRRLYKRRNKSLEWFIGHFSIHIVAHIFDLRCRRPANVSQMENIFTSSTNVSDMLVSLRHAGAPGLDLLGYQGPDPDAGKAKEVRDVLTDNSDIYSATSNLPQIVQDHEPRSTAHSAPVSEDTKSSQARELEIRRDSETTISTKNSEDEEDVGDEADEEGEEEEDEAEADNLEVGDSEEAAEASIMAAIAGALGPLVDANGLEFEWLYNALMGTERWHYAQLLHSTKKFSLIQNGGMDMENSSVIPCYEPGSYLEIIPWDELQCVNGKDLPDNISGAFGISKNDSFCYYNPKQYSPRRYHFISEEEVLQFRIQRGIYSFGYLVDGKVLFRLSDVNYDFFCSDYLHFWQLWNDCALTIRPSDGRTMLLSTLPGQRYRETFRNFDYLAALTLHRREIDNYISPVDVSPIFKRILGSQHTVLHDSLLNYIPLSELSDFGRSDLGKGSFGAVSTAVWHRKQSLEYKSAFSVDVVLKRLQAVYTRQSAAELFAKELQASYLGLTGASTSCTEFFGLTEVPWKLLIGKEEDGSCLCFVFERASEGNLLQYLGPKIEAGDWKDIADHLGGVLGGLNTLHVRGVVHGDLHPGNILLTARKLTAMGKFTEETELSVRLCDFGLSRKVTEASPGGFSNLRAATKYRAPELAAPNAPYTTAADIYAAGIFIFDVLALKARSSSEKAPVLVPRKLWELCKRCIATDPNERPEAIKAVHTLENLKDDDYDEKKNFDLIDLREELRRHDAQAWTVGEEDKSLGSLASLLSHASLQDSLENFL